MEKSMNKLRVGVLMGGKSIEREVSFNSGRTVCDHLDTSRYTIVPLFQTARGNVYILPWHFLHRGKIADFEHRLAAEAQLIHWDNLKQLVDFIYIAMHGQFAEDGTLQGFLEILNIPYLGSGVFASALGMDKLIQKEILTNAGIKVPKSIAVHPYQIEHFDQYEQKMLEQLHELSISVPFIVKPHKEGSSFGVSVVFDQQDLKKAVENAARINGIKTQTAIIEEKIEGMEFSCVTLFDYKEKKWTALLPTEVEHQPNNHIFDYEQKYMPGKAIEFTPARCSSKDLQTIQETCIKTTNVLGFRTIARIDGFLQKDGTVVIVDPNSFSGMAPASFLFREAAHINLNHPQLINHLIEAELDQYGMLDAILMQEKEKGTKSMNEKKLRIAVLMGGQSNEKEISLESGRNVVYKLSPQIYDVLPLFVSSSMELYKIDQTLLVRSATQEIEQLLNTAMKVLWSELPSVADFVFIALHGGKGENGCVQGTVEMLGLPYNGSGVLASALCMDKYKTTMFLKNRGFDVPSGLLIHKQDWQADPEKTTDAIFNTVSLPLIVKPHDDGCSVMVQKIKTKEQLAPALQQLFSNGKDDALIEECIMGMELTVGVIGNEKPRALIPSQAVATSEILSIQEKFLPGAGENQTPAPLPQPTLQFIQRTMEAVYQAIGCKGYARIDCFYQNSQQSTTGKERVIILEVNTLPALTPATCIFHQAAEMGIKPREFINMIVQFGLQEHKGMLTDMANLSKEIIAS